MLRAAMMGAALATTFVAGGAAADPWKDECGDRRGRYERNDDWRRHGGYGGIPKGHLPPPGMCRVWIDGRPAGHQPAPVNCSRAERIASRRGDADVIYGGRGGHGDGRRYSHRYRAPSGGYDYRRVCDYFNAQGACVMAGGRYGW